MGYTIYAEVGESFLSFVERYKDYLDAYSFFYPRIADIELIKIEYTSLVVYKTTHNREGKTVYLYHVLIRMPKKVPKLA